MSELERRMSNRLLAERPADLIFGREGERSSVGEERKGEASMSIPTGLRLPRSTMDVDQIDLQVGSTGSFGLSFTKIPNVDVDLANDKWSNSSFKSGFLPNMSLDKQASQGLLPNNNGRPLGHSLLSPQYVYLLGSPPLNYEGPQPSLREAFGMKFVQHATQAHDDALLHMDLSCPLTFRPLTLLVLQELFPWVQLCIIWTPIGKKFIIVALHDSYLNKLRPSKWDFSPTQ